MTPGWDTQLRGEKGISNSGLKGVQSRAQDSRRKKLETWQDIREFWYEELEGWDECWGSALGKLQVCWASVGTLQGAEFQEELKGVKIKWHERHTALPHCYLGNQGMRKAALLETKPWWRPLKPCHCSKTVGYCTYTAELYMWTGFGTGFLRREPCSTTHILLYPLWQTHFPSFTWCNL